MNIFILILLSILLIILIKNLCNNINFFKNNINVLNENNYNLYTNIDHYRIGDLVKGYGKTPMIGNKKLNLEDGILKYHKNTLAEQYILKNVNNLTHNYKLLNDLIKQKINKKENICIVHLRVGDILDDKYYNNSKEKLLNKFNNNIPDDNLTYSKNLLPNWYIKSKKYYLEKINKLKKYKINSIIIIAASHINIGNYELSSYFINLIKKMFEDYKFKVKLSLANHPDDDLILVANSKYFIPSNGGYSDLLKNISIINNNICL